MVIVQRKEAITMTKTLVILSAAVLIAGCAAQRTASAPPADGAASSARGQIIGTPAQDGKFGKLKIGMTLSEVSALIGGGDDQNHYPTGKGWIPFYFGSDTQRIEILYRGEGCLVFTGGNQFGGGSNELIRIENDAKGSCFKSSS
jgi:hypothetical protein